MSPPAQAPALVNRMRASDAAEFAAIAEPQRAMLLRQARLLARDEDAAKDLVQETMLRAVSNFDRFARGTNIATWMVTILMHVFFDALKHQRVVSRAVPDLIAVADVDYRSSIGGSTDAELHAAIDALEPTLREVVQLCYLKGKRHREVAVLLDEPRSTITRRVKHARLRLRALLTKRRDSK